MASVGRILTVVVPGLLGVGRPEPRVRESVTAVHGTWKQLVVAMSTYYCNCGLSGCPYALVIGEMEDWTGLEQLLLFPLPLLFCPPLRVDLTHLSCELISRRKSCKRVVMSTELHTNESFT